MTNQSEITMSVTADIPANFESISVIGLGYIGLPTAALFASRRVNVLGIDVNSAVIDQVNQGQIHIVEPDLDIVVRSVVTEGYLRASCKPEPAQAFLVAVPTPFVGENREPDLSYIEEASRAIAPVLNKGNLVVLESTCPVGATEKLAHWLAEDRPDLTFPQTHGESSDIRIAHCPERVLPGKVMQELISNDRVIGGMTSKCSAMAVHLYKTFVTGECVVTSMRAAEMAKLTENSFRDVNIAFANELSLICDQLEIDAWEVIELANRHPRVNILRPGPGVGGHCIAVDPWFIVSSAPNRAKLIRKAREVNDQKPRWVVEKVREALAKIAKPNPTVACLGLAFKPDIDDLRESPALAICKELSNLEGVRVLAAEPNIFDTPPGFDIREARLTDTLAALQAADVIVGLVAHSVFKGIDRSLLEGKQVIDACAVWR